MVLTRLELKRFRCFRDSVLNFKPGLNVVRGSNESGKSTLRQALLAAFFGNPTSQSEGVERWTSWGARERCELRLDYTDHAGRACQLRKDFAKQKPLLFIGEEKLVTYHKIQEQIGKEELGLESEEAYALCAALDVRSLANLGSAQTRKDVGKMLARLMTGSADGADALSALKRLDESLRELQKGTKSSAAKDPGPLQKYRVLLPQLQAAAAKVRQDLHSRQESVRELAGLDAEVNQLSEKLQDLKQVLESNQVWHGLKKRLDDYTGRYIKFEQDEKARRYLKEQVAELEAKAMSSLAAITSQECQDLTTCLGQLSALPVPAATAAPAGSTGAPWLGLGIGLAICGLALAGFSGWGWPLAAAGAALALVGWVQRQQGRRRTDAARAQGETLARQRQDLDARVQALVQKAGGLAPDAILRDWPETQRHLAQAEALRKQLASLTPMDEDDRSRMLLELRLAKDQLAEPRFAGLPLSAAEQVKQERELKQSTQSLEELRQRRDMRKGQLEIDAASADRASALEEQLDEVKRQLDYYEARERVILLTKSLLERAKSATLNPARQVLEERAGELFAIFSGGRYRRLLVDDEDLSCKVFVPETETWEDPAILSQGAFDQFYLSLRLALSDVLSGGKRPPLLLDEPLAAFDPERAARTLAWLREAARDRQILLFTCRPDYDKMADHVIELPPAAETGRGA